MTSPCRCIRTSAATARRRSISARSSATPRSPNARIAEARCASCSTRSASPSRAPASTVTTVAPRRTRTRDPHRDPPLTPEVRRPPRRRNPRRLRPRIRRGRTLLPVPAPRAPRPRPPRRARLRRPSHASSAVAHSAGNPQAFGYPQQMISLSFRRTSTTGTLHTVAGERARRVRPSPPIEGVFRARFRPHPYVWFRPA